MKGTPHSLLILVYLTVLVWSSIAPFDYFTWTLEVFPAIIGFIILVTTYKRFKFTSITYSLILLHCCILFIGGHYTYAEVPLFNWIKETFHQDRNNFDKLGHFAQGFVPAMITREIFIRKKIIAITAWRNFLIVATCISISAGYEFLEWFVAVMSGQSADSFLGTQGYIWDTQSDMLYATIGAMAALLILSKFQSKQIDESNPLNEHL